MKITTKKVQSTGLVGLLALFGVFAAPSVLAGAQTVDLQIPEPAAPWLNEDFSSQEIPQDWVVTSGQWLIEDGQLTTTEVGSEILLGESPYDFRFEAAIKLEDLSDGASLGIMLEGLADDTEDADGIEIELHATGELLDSVAFNAYRGNAVPSSTSQTNPSISQINPGILLEPGQTVDLVVEVRGNSGVVEINQEAILETDQLQRGPQDVLGLNVKQGKVAIDSVQLKELAAVAHFDLRNPGEQGLVVGHRGDSAAAPENTMPAIVSAAKNGADFIEIDIDYTSDNVIVALHDDSVDRTTNGSGDIRSLSYQDISELDAGSWFSSAYAGASIPTFEQVLAYLADSGAHLLLEYKNTWDLERVADSAALIAEYGVEDQVIVQSFDQSTLRVLKEQAPHLPRMVLGGIAADSIAVAKELGAIGYNAPGSEMMQNPQWVSTLHEAGLATFAWTINDADMWAELTAMGVDGIVTDQPGELVGWHSASAAQGEAGPEVHGWNPRVSQVLRKPAVVSQIQDAGLQMYTYTANDPQQWMQRTELGIDGIITDYPAQLEGWKARYQQG